MRFEIRKSRPASGKGRSQFYYVLVGSNGEDMMVSETIKQKQMCEKSINSIKRSVTLETPIVYVPKRQT